MSRAFAWGVLLGATTIHLLWGLVIVPSEYRPKYGACSTEVKR